jgi:hypothetical protein
LYLQSEGSFFEKLKQEGMEAVYPSGQAEIILRRLHTLLQRLAGGERDGSAASGSAASSVEGNSGGAKGSSPSRALEMLQWAGPCFDLPHHPSSEEQIEALCAKMAALLTAKDQQQAPCRPAIVTIARSVVDDFTPVDSVRFIEEAVLNALRGLYGEIDVHVDEYEEAPDGGVDEASA